VECSLRVLRAYKIKLLHAYCQEVLSEAYHDGMKAQAVATCQRLRTKSTYFQVEGSNGQFITGENIQLFTMEHSEMLENIFATYNKQGEINVYSRSYHQPYD